MKQAIIRTNKKRPGCSCCLTRLFITLQWVFGLHRLHNKEQSSMIRFQRALMPANNFRIIGFGFYQPLVSKNQTPITPSMGKYLLGCCYKYQNSMVFKFVVYSTSLQGKGHFYQGATLVQYFPSLIHSANQSLDSYIDRLNLKVGVKSGKNGLNLNRFFQSP